MQKSNNKVDLHLQFKTMVAAKKIKKVKVKQANYRNAGRKKANYTTTTVSWRVRSEIAETLKPIVKLEIDKLTEMLCNN